MARCILALLALCVACVEASYTAEARASHSLPPSRKAGFGALFVAHHENTDMNTHFLKLAVTSAKTYRLASPGLQLTLLASRTDGLAADHPFDRTIIIPEAFLVPNDGKSQKLTRTLAYHLTPYLLTLAVDLDTFNCADLVPTLSAIYNDSFSQGRPAPFTIAATGHDAREYKWHPDNGIKLMWWSAELQEVLWAWEESQLQLGIASSDQRSLMEAVKREPQREWRFGRLPRALSVRVRPGLNESFSFAWAERRFSQSLPFIGPLLILHMAGIERFSAELCALANEGDVGAPRAIALRHMSYFPTRETWRQAFSIVHSQQECEAAMQGGCLLHLHWGREELAKEVTPVLPSEYEY